MKYVLILALTLLSACNDEKGQTTNMGAVSPLSCKGIYTVRDTAGDLQKYNQYWQENQKACLTDKIALSTFEASSEKRRKQNIKCKPQAGFPSLLLKADNNFYNYRNGRYFLDLDSSTGEMRRLLIGEDKNGKPVFQRDIACFYQRTDVENEPVNPSDYGSQIMFDFSETPASSADFVPVEIFKYQNAGSGNWTFTRYDDIFDWSASYCPQNTTPFWENCQELRAGNIYFDPVLDSVTQEKLRNEAILIRTQFNFSEISKAEFNSIWNEQIEKSSELQEGGDWKYFVSHFVDANKFYDYDWRAYVKGTREAMPDVSSIGSFSVPICYSGTQWVTLSNGNKARVNGEVCLVNGVYNFTQY